MMRRFQPRKMRKGVTLIELLVVATLMLTLAAVSVPAIKPMMESQLTASAASTVSTYLNRARARAMTTGRSCGVTFERFDGTYDPDSNTGSASLVMRQVEVPPYYSGLELGANVSVAPGNELYINDVDSKYHGMRARGLFVNDLYWDRFVGNEGSPVIQFNNCGPFYPIYIPSAGSAVPNLCIVKLPGIELPTRLNVPFKVKRGPRPTMTSPIGLPQGAVVDLEFSGDETNFFSLEGNVTVMFSPNGSIDYIQDNAGSFIPTETVYFLIGRWDRIAALGWDVNGGEKVTLAEDGLWNYEDPTNFWVTINPNTGLVSTAEVNQPLNYVLSGNEDEIEVEKVAESREFARMSKRNLGGH